MGELLEALLVCQYTLFKMPVLVMQHLGTVAPEVICVRGVISQHSAEMEIGAGLCVSVPSWRRWCSWWLWEGEEGQQSLGLSPVYKWEVSEVCCSFLTLLTLWVRCLCWYRVETLRKETVFCNSEDCCHGGMQKCFDCFWKTLLSVLFDYAVYALV